MSNKNKNKVLPRLAGLLACLALAGLAGNSVQAFTGGQLYRGQCTFSGGLGSYTCPAPPQISPPPPGTNPNETFQAESAARSGLINGQRSLTNNPYTLQECGLNLLWEGEFGGFTWRSNPTINLIITWQRNWLTGWTPIRGDKECPAPGALASVGPYPISTRVNVYNRPANIVNEGGWLHADREDPMLEPPHLNDPRQYVEGSVTQFTNVLDRPVRYHVKTNPYLDGQENRYQCIARDLDVEAGYGSLSYEFTMQKEGATGSATVCSSSNAPVSGNSAAQCRASGDVLVFTPPADETGDYSAFCIVSDEFGPTDRSRMILQPGDTPPPPPANPRDPECGPADSITTCATPNRTQLCRPPATPSSVTKTDDRFSWTCSLDGNDEVCGADRFCAAGEEETAEPGWWERNSEF